MRHTNTGYYDVKTGRKGSLVTATCYYNDLSRLKEQSSLEIHADNKKEKKTSLRLITEPFGMTLYSR